MGEEPRSVGFEAEDVAINFIRSLGYQILEAPNEEFNIDCLAEFPPVIGYRGLRRPRHSLDGLTAFEIKSETCSRAKIDNFERKILQYNANVSNRQIKCGIFFIDRKISNVMHRYMESKGIYGWDARRLSFYENKLRIFNKWMDYGITTEIIIDDSTSYLRCFSPFDKEKVLMRLSIFFDDHAHVLSVARIRGFLEKIRKQSLCPLIDNGLVPINSWVEFHALGGGRNPVRDLSFLKSEWMKFGINLTIGTFHNYRTFPQLTRLA